MSNQLGRIIEFNRPQKYLPKKLLGEGACGQTILVTDEEMGVDLVIKKYSPIFCQSENPELFRELLGRFREEARILFLANHPNIVRVFNYFDYSEHSTSYIVLEYVEGQDILTHLSKKPLSIERVFKKVIGGFGHLEAKKILHRDIRPANILIDKHGEPKIIDFGFGKHEENSLANGEKSISLNWWCATPPELSNGLYDQATEVYFVGKLFEEAIKSGEMSDFPDIEIIRKMCEPEREGRFRSFSEVAHQMAAREFQEIIFTARERETYKAFSDGIHNCIAKIYPEAKYREDSREIVTRLEDLYARCMLEEYIPAVDKLLQVFVLGGFSYYNNRGFETNVVRDFLKLLKSQKSRKQLVIIQNLFERLDSITREQPKPYDDIPF